MVNESSRLGRALDSKAGKVIGSRLGCEAEKRVRALGPSLIIGGLVYKK